MVQPILRLEPRQGILDRITYADYPLVLYPDGTERDIRQRLGHHIKGVERLLKKDGRRARLGPMYLGFELVPARIVKVKI